MASPSNTNKAPPELYARSKQHVAEMREGMNSLAWAQLPPPKERLNPRDRLGRSGKGRPGPGRRIVSFEEVREHNDLSKDGWVIFEDKVYAITRYASYHPGGYYVLAGVTGDDCTVQFNELHPWIQCHAMLKDYYVGDIESGGKSTSDAAKSSKRSSKVDVSQLRKVGLPVLTRGLTGWMQASCSKWQVVSKDRATVLVSFDAVEAADRKEIMQQNISRDLAKHVMFKLGTKFVRAYSNLLTAWPDQEKELMPIVGLDPKQIHLVIRLYKKGRLTKLLHKKIVEGKEIVGDFAYVKSHVRFINGEIKEAGDRSAWTAPSSSMEHLVLVCAGTGVLPLLAFIQQCLYERINKRDAPKVLLFYGASSEETIIFYDWLKQLAKKYKEWFNVVFVVATAPKKWKGEVGHLGDDVFSKDWSTLAWTNSPEENLDEVTTSPNTRVIICGPPGFDKYGPMDVSKLTNIPTCLVKKGFNPEFIFSM